MSVLVGVCDGPRCRALRGLAAQDPLEELRTAVRETRGAVLLALECPGLCAHGVVGMLARHPGSATEADTGAGTEADTGTATSATWLSCVERDGRTSALVERVRAQAR